MPERALKKIKATLVFHLFCGNAWAWAGFPKIGVSLPESERPEETTIAINPVNPMNLAGGAKPGIRASALTATFRGPTASFQR